MNYEIKDAAAFESHYNASGDYQAIVDLLEKDQREQRENLKACCHWQAEAYVEQFDVQDSEWEGMWDVKWATEQYYKLVCEQMEQDATRLYLFAVTSPRPGFDYIRDEDHPDYGHCKVIAFAGRSFITIHTSETEDTVVAIEPIE